MVVRSPGVSRYRPEARAIERAGVRLTTGTNLWFAEHPDAPAIGITGSKGKSTTAALAAHLASRAGRDVRLAGNIGVPLAGFLGPDPGPPPDLWVLELSSYQTSDLDASPPVGVLLNLLREHTDWHGTQERYHADKLNLFAHRSDMASVLNAPTPPCGRRARRSRTRSWFRDPGASTPGRRASPAPARRTWPAPTSRWRASTTSTTVRGALCTRTRGGQLDDPAGAIAGFRPLAHRLEPVGERDGVLWVDDSIATIPEATVAAARALAPRPTVILVGGRDRAQDYGPLAAYLASGGRRWPAWCDARERRRRAGPGGGGGRRAGGRRRVAGGRRGAGRRMVPEGGAVLLSPGAPSGDDFADFAARGDAFRRLAGGPARPDAGGGGGGRAGSPGAKWSGTWPPPDPHPSAARRPQAAAKGPAARPENLLTATVLALVCFGLVMVFSTSSATALLNDGDPLGLVIRQAAYALVGLGAYAVLVRMPPESIRRLGPPRMAVSVFLLLVVLVPSIGMHGQRLAALDLARRDRQLQPSELAKLRPGPVARQAVARDPRRLRDARRPGPLPAGDRGPGRC